MSSTYGRVFGSKGVPEGMEDVYRVLRTGADPNGQLSPTAAALVFDFGNNLKAAKGMFAGTMTRALQDTFEGKDEAARIAMTHAAEAGVDNEMSQAFKLLREQLVADGVDLGDIENYVPHLWSRPARDFLWGDSELAVKLRGHLRIDPTAAPGITKSRVIKPGTKFTVKHNGNDVVLEFQQGTVKEINEKLQAAFPELGIGKWLEDDGARLM